VRVARARFYPSLTLHAGVGYQAFNTKYLFVSPESLIYNAAGDLVAPVINRRAIKADYLNANARQLQAVYEYQKTILTAFTEVINYLAKVENYGRSIEVKQQQLEALEGAIASANQLFQAGRTEYLEVLFVQRELMEARIVLIETKRQQLVAVVNAYQALGGGGAATYELSAGGPENPPGEVIPLQQPLQLRPGAEVIPPPGAPAPAEPELLPPVS
jgi:outer membrane protein TolC